MFEAFSIRKSKIVNVTNEYDVNETFLCPNPYCSAELKLKSIDGKRAKHFASLRGMKSHDLDCPYANISPISYHSSTLYKSSLEDILHGLADNREFKTKVPLKHALQNPTPEISYIHTPKQLLNFCLTSSLNDLYRDGLLVDDIILDSRNITRWRQGVKGIRLIVGYTFCYSEATLSIEFIVRNRIQKNSINAIVIFPNLDAFRKVKNYYLEFKRHKDEKPKFSGYPIAVLSNWITFIDEKTQRPKLLGSVERKRQVIYRF